MKRISLVLASALVLSSAGAAFATDSGGVKITGHVTNDVYADFNTNSALGSDAVAVQSIGSIVGDTDISGTLHNTVGADFNDNLASGSDSLACQSIGTIGDAKACEK